ncbi:MAG: hypothetical protein N3B11_01010 [Coriobacteriia bacterium]|nr:hypothetical protein [Coriobacteriia bacterium]
MSALRTKPSIRLGRALSVVAAFAAVVFSLPCQSPSLAAPAEQKVTLSVRHARPAYTADSTFTVDVVADLAAPAGYFEARIRITSPSGRLLYQKTEVRHRVPAGRTSISFSRSLADLGVRQGRYPVEVRVLASGAAPTVAKSRLLVLGDAARTRVPVVLAVHVTSPPSTDPDGRFAIDPALYPRPRSDVERLLDTAARHPAAPIALAVAPVLVEEWLRAADGYDVLDPGGVRAVPPEDPTAIGADALVRGLREAVGARRIEVLDVPYAEPDLRQLASIGAIEDLREHWSLTDAVLARAIGSSPASGTALLGEAPPDEALAETRRRGCRFVLVSPGRLLTEDTTASPGAYRVGHGLVALAPSAALADAAHADDPDSFYDVLFDRAVSDEPTTPLVALFELGAGATHTAADVERAATWIEAAPWVIRTSAADAASTSPNRGARSSSATADRAAPQGFWDDVWRARTHSRALSAALGHDDPAATAVRRDSLIAESALWAGPDRAYAFAERALAYARAATESARRYLDAIAIDAKDVTLPDVSGDVPISIVNRSDKPLRLGIQVHAARGSVRQVPSQVVAQPGENVVTVNVDVRGELRDTVKVSLTAGDLQVASTQIGVRASYLDRVVAVGGVVLFLSALLAYIRRRAKRADAGTIASGAP